MEKCVSILLLIFFKVFFKEKRVISKNTLAQPSTPSGLSMISGALCIMGAWYLTRTEPPILTKMPGVSSMKKLLISDTFTIVLTRGS